jgi:hypothetical protein
MENFRKMVASGLPEVEEIKGDIAVTEIVTFDKPSIERRTFDGTQKIWRFKNGFGASVVKHFGSYGFDADLWELAVLKFEEKGEWHLTYDTPITEDVIGHLKPQEVTALLKRIKKLAKEETER